MDWFLYDNGLCHERVNRKQIKEAKISTEGVVRRCSLKKRVLQNFIKFIGKHLCRSVFSNKITGLRLFCEIFKSTFLIEQLRWLLLLMRSSPEQF